MSQPIPEARATVPQAKPRLQDAPFGRDIQPVRCETSPQEASRHSGAPTLRTMSMRRALDTCDAAQLSELSPVTLASMTKSMWATIKLLSADANRWRLLRRRACLLDRRMLDGPYRIPDVDFKKPTVSISAVADGRADVMDLDDGDGDDGLRPRERLALDMDRVVDKWTVIPYIDELQGPDEKKDDVFDSADFYVSCGRVGRVVDKCLRPGQRRWEKEISAQLLLYRLCLVFQEAPMVDSGAWLFIVRSDDGAEIWFADRGNFHWFIAVCPSDKAMAGLTELLELLISDRCVIRYTSDPDADQPTAGETIGAAWSR